MSVTSEKAIERYEAERMQTAIDDLTRFRDEHQKRFDFLEERVESRIRVNVESVKTLAKARTLICRGNVDEARDLLERVLSELDSSWRIYA